MKYINFFFHIYQPPIQDAKIVDRIVRECYRPLTKQIVAFKQLKFTLNINYSLTEQLDRIAPDVLDNIRQAYQQGNLELTESGAYHPIFPLIPEKEIERQLKLNRQGNQRLLLKEFAPQGIFPPEMAFSPSLATLFKQLGYQWTIVDDFSLGHYGISTPYDEIYTCDEVAVFLRSNLWSNKFAQYDSQWHWETPQDFVQELEASLTTWMGEKDGYLIIALDGETFGHHIKAFDEQFLVALFEAFAQSEVLQLAHLSTLHQKFKPVPQFIPPSSWSLDDYGVQKRDYYSLWKSEGNKIHQLQWDFTYYVL